jgi:hypothetical protein
MTPVAKSYLEHWVIHLAMREGYERSRRLRALTFLLVGLVVLAASALLLTSYFEGQQVGGVGVNNPHGMAQSFDPRYRTLQYTVTAQNGRAVDVYLMDQSQYSRFLAGQEFEFIPEGSTMDVMSYSAQVSVSGSEAKVLLVLDSPGNPAGMTDVTMDFVAWATSVPPFLLEILVVLGFLLSFIGLAMYVKTM